MPETMSVERRKMLALLGAELVLTEGAEGHEGRHRQGRGTGRDDRRTRSFRSSSKTRPIPKSTAGPPPRKSGTTRDGKVDIFVAGIGTGGTITGVGQVLKKRKPGVQVVAVEPEASPVLSGGQPGPHKIQGIGAGFAPQILDTHHL